MKMLAFPMVWAFTLTLTLPSHQPSSAPAGRCCREANRCSRVSHGLTALQMEALDQVAAETDNAGPASPHTGGAAPDIVLD